MRALSQDGFPIPMRGNEETLRKRGYFIPGFRSP